MKDKGIDHFFKAVLLISIGIVLLLINIDVISMEIKEMFLTYYPLVFIYFGLKWLLEAIVTKGTRRGWFIPILFIVFGTLLLMGNLEIITFSVGMVWKLWPVLLIYIGVRMFTKKRIFPRVIVKKTNDDSLGDEIKSSFSIGDVKYNQPNWHVKPLSLKNAIGDYYFDFSKAFIPEKETTIDISGWAGDVKLLMPEDVEFRLEAKVKAGDIKVFGDTADGINRSYVYETENYESAIKKLTLIISLKAGSIRVDKV